MTIRALVAFLALFLNAFSGAYLHKGRGLTDRDNEVPTPGTLEENH